MRALLILIVFTVCCFPLLSQSIDTTANIIHARISNETGLNFIVLDIPGKTTPDSVLNSNTTLKIVAQYSSGPDSIALIFESSYQGFVSYEYYLYSRSSTDTLDAKEKAWIIIEKQRQVYRETGAPVNLPPLSYRALRNITLSSYNTLQFERQIAPQSEKFKLEKYDLKIDVETRRTKHGTSRYLILKKP